MIFYSLKEILDRLKKEGYSANRTILNFLMKKGIMPLPTNFLYSNRKNKPVGFKGKDYTNMSRLYTAEEVELIMKILRVNLIKKNDTDI